MHVPFRRCFDRPASDVGMMETRDVAVAARGSSPNANLNSGTMTVPSDATTLSSVDSHVTDAHEGRDRRRKRSPRASMEDVSSSASPPSYPTRFDASQAPDLR